MNRILFCENENCFDIKKLYMIDIWYVIFFSKDTRPKKIIRVRQITKYITRIQCLTYWMISFEVKVLVIFKVETYSYFFKFHWVENSVIGALQLDDFMFESFLSNEAFYMLFKTKITKSLIHKFIFESWMIEVLFILMRTTKVQLIFI